MKHKCRGMVNITVMLAMATIIVLLGTVLYLERASMRKEIKDLTEEKTRAENRAETAEEEATALKNNLILERGLKKAAEEESLLNKQKNEKLEKDMLRLAEKLPVPKPRSVDTKADPEQEIRSMKRLELLWEAYCLEESEATECIKKEEAQ